MDSQYFSTQVELARKLFKVQFVGLFRFFIPREKRRKIVCEFVDSLSRETFVIAFPNIIRMIDKRKGICKKFPNTEEQVKDILNYLPRLKEFRGMLKEVIGQNRKRYGLKV